MTCLHVVFRESTKSHLKMMLRVSCTWLSVIPIKIFPSPSECGMFRMKSSVWHFAYKHHNSKNLSSKLSNNRNMLPAEVISYRLFMEIFGNDLSKQNTKSSPNQITKSSKFISNEIEPNSLTKWIWIQRSKMLKFISLCSSVCVDRGAAKMIAIVKHLKMLLQSIRTNERTNNNATGNCFDYCDWKINEDIE